MFHLKIFKIVVNLYLFCAYGVNLKYHCVFRQGDPDIAQILLDKGADILGTNRFGLSPLHLACRHGNTG